MSGGAERGGRILAVHSGRMSSTFQTPVSPLTDDVSDPNCQIVLVGLFYLAHLGRATGPLHYGHTVTR